jgi:hypothetical protein
MLMRLRGLERRITAEEGRNDAVDVGQARQDDRIATTEDVLEIKYTVTKKTDGTE